MSPLLLAIAPTLLAGLLRSPADPPPPPGPTVGDVALLLVVGAGMGALAARAGRR